MYPITNTKYNVFLYVCFVDRCLSFCNFVFAIVLSVRIRFMDSDHIFGIFKLFLYILETMNHEG